MRNDRRAAISGTLLVTPAGNAGRFPEPSYFCRFADLAQLVEQLICNQQVASSSLAVGSEELPLRFSGGAFFVLAVALNEFGHYSLFTIHYSLFTFHLINALTVNTSPLLNLTNIIRGSSSSNDIVRVGVVIVPVWRATYSPCGVHTESSNSDRGCAMISMVLCSVETLMISNGY